MSKLTKEEARLIALDVVAHSFPHAGKVAATAAALLEVQERTARACAELICPGGTEYNAAASTFDQFNPSYGIALKAAHDTILKAFSPPKDQEPQAGRCRAGGHVFGGVTFNICVHCGFQVHDAEELKREPKPPAHDCARDGHVQGRATIDESLVTLQCVHCEFKSQNSSAFGKPVQTECGRLGHKADPFPQVAYSDTCGEYRCTRPGCTFISGSPLSFTYPQPEPVPVEEGDDQTCGGCKHWRPNPPTHKGVDMCRLMPKWEYAEKVHWCGQWEPKTP